MARALLLITSICAAALTRAGDQPPLGFYVVSEKAGPGLHFFDSATLPKLGYIADKPDLSISQLEAVSVGRYSVKSSLVHKDGSVEESRDERPAVDIRLIATDAKSLEALTSAHLGARMLFVAGGDPISAPVIRAPISGQDVQIALSPGTDAERLTAKLQAFVRKP